MCCLLHNYTEVAVKVYGMGKERHSSNSIQSEV